MRVQLRDANAGFIAAYHEIYAPRVHAGRPANLGHGPRDRLPAFFVQVSSQDLLALAVPPFMEQLLIKKYKLKNNGPPVKVCLYEREYCQYKVQLQWRAGRVGFSKGWSEFTEKAQIAVDDTLVFTPWTTASSCSSTGRTPLWRSPGAAKSTAMALGRIHAIVDDEADGVHGTCSLFLSMRFVNFCS